MSETALRAAVVGAGPSGFYATDQLLKAGFEVDLLEVLPTPFGLVRAGVAPDHPKIKSVTRVYEKTAKHPGFRFYGSVELGGHVGRQDLLDRYHVVLDLAIGIAIRACQAGHRVLFATASEWVARLAEAHHAGRLQQELIRLGRYPLLVVDEVGYIPFEPEAANLFFQLVSSRYERAA